MPLSLIEPASSSRPAGSKIRLGCQGPGLIHSTGINWMSRPVGSDADGVLSCEVSEISGGVSATPSPSRLESPRPKRRGGCACFFCPSEGGFAFVIGHVPVSRLQLQVRHKPVSLHKIYHTSAPVFRMKVLLIHAHSGG